MLLRRPRRRTQPPRSTVLGTQTGTATTTVVSSVSTPLYDRRKLLSLRCNSVGSECMNTYGAPPAMYTAPPAATTTTATDSGNGGSGMTHTVIVAPAQGSVPSSLCQRLVVLMHLTVQQHSPIRAFRS